MGSSRRRLVPQQPETRHQARWASPGGSDSTELPRGSSGSANSLGRRVLHRGGRTGTSPAVCRMLQPKPRVHRAAARPGGLGAGCGRTPPPEPGWRWVPAEGLEGHEGTQRGTARGGERAAMSAAAWRGERQPRPLPLPHKGLVRVCSPRSPPPPGSPAPLGPPPPAPR